MKSVRSFLFVLLAIMLLAACAQTGQVVPLAPAANVAESSAGGNREVAVRAVDQHDDKVLGQLENRRSSPAELTTAQDLETIMEEAASEALRRKGFRPVPWDAEAPRSLTVQINELEHVVSSDMPRNVSTRVELGFEATHGSRGLGGSARYSHADTMLNRPSAEENGALISEALDEALQRMMDDRLVNFLAEP